MWGITYRSRLGKVNKIFLILLDNKTFRLYLTLSSLNSQSTIVCVIHTFWNPCDSIVIESATSHADTKWRPTEGQFVTYFFTHCWRWQLHLNLSAIQMNHGKFTWIYNLFKVTKKSLLRKRRTLFHVFSPKKWKNTVSPKTHDRFRGYIHSSGMPRYLLLREIRFLRWIQSNTNGNRSETFGFKYTSTNMHVLIILYFMCLCCTWPPASKETC